VNSGSTRGGIYLTQQALIDLDRQIEVSATKANAARREAADARREADAPPAENREDQSKRTNEADAANRVRQALSAPIPLTFEVSAGAAEAGRQVVAAIQAALAGAAFQVPVTAVVTVDAGGARAVGADDIALQAAKTGTRQTQ
jgi:hypothetical protein